MAALRRVSLSASELASGPRREPGLADGRSRPCRPARRRPPRRRRRDLARPSGPDSASRAGRCCTSPSPSISAIGVGTASMLVGALLVLLVSLLGVRPGLGTLLNVLVIGVALNAAPGQLRAGHAPVARASQSGCWRCWAGPCVFAVGCAVYVGAHLGPGPRDGADARPAPAAPDRSGRRPGDLRGRWSRPRVVARRPGGARHGSVRRRRRAVGGAGVQVAAAATAPGIATAAGRSGRREDLASRADHGSYCPFGRLPVRRDHRDRREPSPAGQGRGRAVRAGVELPMGGDVTGSPDPGDPVRLSHHRGARGEGGQATGAPVERVAVAQTVGEAGTVGGRLSDDGGDGSVPDHLDQARSGINHRGPVGAGLVPRPSRSCGRVPSTRSWTARADRVASVSCPARRSRCGAATPGGDG